MGSETLRPLAIFGVGLYLGLSFFKGESKHKREESVFLKDLRNDFERTSGVSNEVIGKRNRREDEGAA